MARDLALAAPRRLPVLSVIGVSWAIALLCLAALVRGEAAGWLLIALSYVMVLALTPAREDTALRRVLVVSVTAHHILSLVNAYGFTVWSATGDAGTFHSHATRLAASSGSLPDWQGQVGSPFYIWFLSRWYLLLGPHLLVGQAVGILAFLAFSVLVFRIAQYAGLNPHQASGVTLLCGLLPSMAMVTSVTLREPWKLLFLALLVYASLRYFRSGWNPFYFVLWVFSALALALFHTGFGPLLPILLVLPYLLLPGSLRARHSSGPRALALVLSLVAVTWLLTSPLNIAGDWIELLASGEAVTEAESFRAGAIRNVGRSTYGIALDTSSPLAVAGTSLLAYVVYLGAPFPWQIHAPIDLYGVLDAMLGLVFIGASLWHHRVAQDRDRRRTILYLLAVFFAISFVHALGTANYGTATRHRLLTTWIAFALGWPILADGIKRLRRRLRPG